MMQPWRILDSIDDTLEPELRNGPPHSASPSGAAGFGSLRLNLVLPWALLFAMPSLFLAPSAVGQEHSREADSVRLTGGGPDLTILSITSATNFGIDGDFQAYSFGTSSCNQGDQPVLVCIDSNDPSCQANEHPVMAHNLYRLEGDDFQQIGMSWLFHLFVPVNGQDPACGTCQPPSSHSNRLGAGCTDSHSASIQGSRPLGQRSEVNSATGSFPFPITEVPFAGNVEQRLRVLRSDLEPSLHPNARYFAESQHIAADDAAAGNAFNNASYREVLVSPATLSLNPIGNTIVGKPALFAWAANDPDVSIVAIDVPGSPGERFHAARKISPTANGWEIRYAIHNLSSHRSAGSFTVEFPNGTSLLGAEFHGIEHHSGEPYDSAPWSTDISDGSAVTFQTDSFDINPNANALRWGTLFQFTIRADRLPVSHTLGLFQPGKPDSIGFNFSGDLFFFDGFESGDTSQWTGVVP